MWDKEYRAVRGSRRGFVRGFHLVSENQRRIIASSEMRALDVKQLFLADVRQNMKMGGVHRPFSIGERNTISAG